MNTTRASAEFLEREIKLWAEPGSLDTFLEFGKFILKAQTVLGAGADRYWTHPKFKELPAIRHRFNSDYSELTVKSKKHGNLVRHEVNLPLNAANNEEVERLLELQGYTLAMEIHKISHILYTPTVVYSWYSVLRPDGMIHMVDGAPAQFVEIELNEKLDWFDQYQQAKGQAGSPEEVEEFCSDYLHRQWDRLMKLGIVGDEGARINRSLWELFGPKDWA